MRRYAVIGLLFLLSFSMVGCGAKDANSIVEDLSDRSKEMDSYSSEGKLSIKSDHGSQEYDVEIWYKKPDLYRVRLKNVERGLTQILLRNKQGVYVLTPHLKKSFRFQSGWPAKNSQVYLYQTVLSSIITDAKRKFTVSKKEYQFEVAANYPFNPMLKKQQIVLDEDLNPKKISVLNDKQEVVMKMQFDRFEENASFDKDSFDMQYNMNSLKAHETFGAILDKKKATALTPALPSFVPMESTLVEAREIKNVNGMAVVMRYLGKKSFTFTQRIEGPGRSAVGEPVDLADTVGVLVDQGKRQQLCWIRNGIEFELLGDISAKELIQIAMSTFGEQSE